MARSVLDIIFRLAKEGGADREVIKGLVQVKSTIAQAGMVAAAVTGTLYTLKKGFDFAKEGAQLQFVEDRFKRLADSIGANANLMNELRDVTRGLYSDTELMANASDLMSLGLAKSSEELMRLSKVSAGLNMNMNQLVLTLANKTTMRFDALGVSVDGFKEKVAALEAAGMSADEAFKEAFLQQAEAQLKRVGEAADSSVGSFMRLETEAKNFMDQMKKDGAEFSLPIVNGFINMLEAGEDYRAATELVAKSHGTTYEAMSWLVLVSKDYRNEVENIVLATRAAESSAAAWTSALSSTVEVQASLQTNLEGVLGLSLNLTESNASYSEKLTEINEKIAEATIKYGENSEEVGKLRTELQGLEADHSMASAQIVLGLLKEKGATVDMQLEFARSSGLVSDDAYLMVKDFDSIAAALIDPNTKMGDMNQKLKALQNLAGQSWLYTFILRTIGGMPDLPKKKVHGPYGGSGGGEQVDWGAAGGQLKQGRWTLVGDMPGGQPTPYSELISPGGYVFDSKTTRKLLESGLIENFKAMGYGGTIDVYVPSNVKKRKLPGMLGYTPHGGRGSVTGAGMAGEGGTMLPGIESAQAMTEQAVTPLVETTEEAVRSVAQSQAMQAFEQRQTRATMESGNRELLDKVQELIDLERSNQSVLVKAVTTGVQQVMG